MLTSYEIGIIRNEISYNQKVWKENLSMYEASNSLFKRAQEICVIFSSESLSEDEAVALRVELLDITGKLQECREASVKYLEADERLLCIGRDVIGDSVVEILHESRSIEVIEDFLSRLVEDKTCKVYVFGIEAANIILKMYEVHDKG